MASGIQCGLMVWEGTEGRDGGQKRGLSLGNQKVVSAGSCLTCNVFGHWKHSLWHPAPPIHLHAPFQGDSTCSLQQAPRLDCDPGHSEPRLWFLCQSTEIFLSECILNTCFTQSISHMTLGRVKKIFYCRRLTCKSLLCLYNAYSVLTEWLYLACVMVEARIRMMLLGYHFHVEGFLSESHFQLI